MDNFSSCCFIHPKCLAKQTSVICPKCTYPHSLNVSAVISNLSADEVDYFANSFSLARHEKHYGLIVVRQYFFYVLPNDQDGLSVEIFIEKIERLAYKTKKTYADILAMVYLRYCSVNALQAQFFLLSTYLIDNLQKNQLVEVFKSMAAAIEERHENDTEPLAKALEYFSPIQKYLTQWYGPKSKEQFMICLFYVDNLLKCRPFIITAEILRNFAAFSKLAIHKKIITDRKIIEKANEIVEYDIQNSYTRIPTIYETQYDILRKKAPFKKATGQLSIEKQNRILKNAQNSGVFTVGSSNGRQIVQFIVKHLADATEIIVGVKNSKSEINFVDIATFLIPLRNFQLGFMNPKFHNQNERFAIQYDTSLSDCYKSLVMIAHDFFHALSLSDVEGFATSDKNKRRLSCIIKNHMREFMTTEEIWLMYLNLICNQKISKNSVLQLDHTQEIFLTFCSYTQKKYFDVLDLCKDASAEENAASIH